MQNKKIVIGTSGGFAIEPRNKRIDRYILAQSTASKPKICFIGTASGDSKSYIQRFYNFFNQENCTPSHLPLFKTKIIDREGFLLAQDIIYVGGGNTKNMLAIWRDWGIDKILEKAYHQGVILSGISAGSLCWFEQGISDSVPEHLSALNCLGFIKGSNVPFYGEEKKKIYPEWIKSGTISSGIATEISVGVHYENGVLKKVFSSRKGPKAYKYIWQEEQLVEEIIKPEYIELSDTILKTIQPTHNWGKGL